MGGDGDPCDALVLGARLPRGARVSVEIIGAIGFLDAGDDDTKLVCAPAGTRPAGRAAALVFMHLYALAKRGLNLARGKSGRTACLGWQEPRCGQRA